MVHKTKTNKKLLFAYLGVVLAVGASVYYISAHNNTPQSSTTESSTQEQKLSSEDQKAEVDEKAAQLQSQTQQGSTNKVKAVTPIITSWQQNGDNVEVVARVPGVIEDGGTCTLKLVKGSSVVTGSRKGVSNVSEVSCGYIAIPRSKLSAGSWTATVSYSSAKAAGTSTPEVVSLQ